MRKGLGFHNRRSPKPGGAAPVTGFAVLPSSGSPTYTVTRTVLDSAGTSYSVPATVLDSAGTSYTPI